MAGVDGLDPVFAAKIRQLVAASGGRIKIVSGYRSVERQSALWNAAVSRYGSAKAARKWVAPPGKSNHNHGKAVDLGGDLKLAHRLAPSLGLTFPMSHEPWHVEPAGHRGSKDAYTDSPSSTSTVPSSISTPTVDQEPFTVEYQLMNLGRVLMGGGDATQDES